jgi:ubiquitin thioesterase CYLD
MFDANPQNLRATNIASIFRNSLFESRAKLATIPPFLVLVAPRHTRSKRSYPYVIPDRQITLDNNIVQLVCLKCHKTNDDPETSRDFYSCDECYSKDSSSSLPISTTDATVACYCGSCLRQSHQNLRDEVHNHNLKRIAIDKHKLNLFAVLCIETSHYVAFVKCQNRSQQEHKWLFFDSMSDRIHNEKNVPRVDRVPDFDQWVDQAERDKYFFEDLDKRRNRGEPTSQTFNENEMRQLRLFRDGAFFFYENSSVNYQ